MSQVTRDTGPPNDEGQAPPQDPADVEQVSKPPISRFYRRRVRPGVTRDVTPAVPDGRPEAELIAGRLASASQWFPVGASIAFADCERNVIAVTITDKDGTKREYTAEVRPIGGAA
jgi:hypothetical protein